MGIYLAEGQTFEVVVRHDTEILRKAGVTHQQVGDALEKVIQCFNWHSYVKDRKVNDILFINAVGYRGFDICPYDKNLVASRDFFVSGILNNGNKVRSSVYDPTMVTGMMPDLIRKLHFFEGNVPYGINPEWAIQVYEIVERNGANIWVPQKKTVYNTGSANTGSAEDILSKNFLGSQELKADADRVIQLAPDVNLYMKGDRGVIFAERPFKFPPDFLIDGLPINNYSRWVGRGQTFIDKIDIVVG